MKQLLLLTILIITITATYADNAKKKEKKISLYGAVIDAKSKAGPDSVFLTLMNADSTVIDTTSAKKWESEWQMRASTNYEFEVKPEPKKFIIKGEAVGYYPNYVDFEIKKVARNRWFELPMMKLRPMKHGVPDSVMLDEVVVKATKIKMVTKGDTIVYNADAFPLEEGSMLDALVRQLPGAQLSSDGEITVNGEKVEELTLNGKDFFKGNNKVMLENLPSFTVKNIQVYHKSSKQSEWAGRELEQKKFTMDVQLKRQYNTGFLGNAEVGGGTEDRYLARFFALRYTDCSRLSAYGNMNNVNENRKPGQNGEWEPANQPQGEQVKRTAGIDLHIDEKEQRWEENANVEFSWDKSTDETETNAEQYLSSQNSFSRSMSSSVTKSKDFSFYNEFRMNKPQWFLSETSVNYTENDGSGLSRSVNSDASLVEWGSVQNTLDSVFDSQLNPQLQAKLINRNKSNSLSNYKYLMFRQGVGGMVKLSSGDYIGADAKITYSDTKSTSYNLNDINYFRIKDSDIFQNKYNTTPSHKYEYQLEASYHYNATDHFSLEFGTGFTQNYDFQEKSIYNLEKLSGWGSNTEHPFGELPSNRDSLLYSIDANNSYVGNKMKKTISFFANPRWQMFNDSIQFMTQISNSLNYTTERLDYHSTSIDTQLSQRNWLYNPYFFVYYDNNKKNIGFNIYGSFKASAPSLYDMVDKTNDADPLNIHLGNPDLKNQYSETFSGNFHKTWKKKNEIRNSIGVSWEAQQNAVSQGFTYNATTGGYTYKPMNVDGNWNASFDDDVNIGFGEQKRLNFNNSLAYSFAQSVDMASVEGQEDSGLSKVHTNTIEDHIKLEYRKDDDLSLGITGKVTYRHSTSDQTSFQTINATNFSYGFNGTYKVPYLKFTLATDIKMFSRRGYASADLNTDDLVWNASISKSFCKKKLTARLEAFDLLHQLTNTTITINAQGRTETVSNTLPRYAMLHLQYNFNIMPKMKK